MVDRVVEGVYYILGNKITCLIFHVFFEERVVLVY